jgi:ABC-type multidrug transport system fused ATPase/permease subunit
MSVLLLAIFCLLFGVAVGLYSCYEISLVILACMPLSMLGLYFPTQDGWQSFCLLSAYHPSGLFKIAPSLQKEQAFLELMSKEVKSVVSMNLCDTLHRRYDRVLHQIYRSTGRHTLFLSLKIGISCLLGTGSLSLVFWMAGYLASHKLCGAVDIVRAIAATSLTSSLSKSYLNQLPNIADGWAAASRVIAVLKMQGAGPMLNRIEHHQHAVTRGKIVFENVSFSYPSRPEALVLDNVSFEIAAGSSAAFVGSSGSGLAS